MMDYFPTKNEKPKIILGTDWLNDIGDALALRLLCRLHTLGKIELLGVVANSLHPLTKPSLCGFLQNEGLILPCGIDSSVTIAKSAAFHEIFAQNKKSTIEFYSSKELLFELFSQHKNIIYIENGFQTALSGFLFSSFGNKMLKGYEMLSDSVNKIYLMAGRFDNISNWEFNICYNKDTISSAVALNSSCPVPLIYSGFEVGYNVSLAIDNISDGMIKRAVEVYGKHSCGSHAWDAMNALLGAIDEPYFAGYELIKADISINKANGTVSYCENESSKDCIVKKLKDNQWYSSRIEELIS